jgi:hypothetical protein
VCDGVDVVRVQPVGGIQAVCFSEDSIFIISCARNPASTVFVWAWRQQELLWRKDTKSSVPPAVYGCKWNRVEKVGAHIAARASHVHACTCYGAGGGMRGAQQLRSAVTFGRPTARATLTLRRLG